MYEVEYTPSDEDSTATRTQLVGPDVGNLDLDVSADFRMYLIQVRSYTEVGPGPYSDAIEVLLEEDGTKNL